jgi:hypothetical protein
MFNLSTYANTEITNKEKISKIDKPKVIGWVIVGIIIIAYGTGQKSSTTITNSTGTHNVTSCSGIGVCLAEMMPCDHCNKDNELPNISLNDYKIGENFPDGVFSANLYYSKESNQIRIAVKNSSMNENSKKFFYDDSIDFLSSGEEMIINDPKILESINSTEPIKLKGGKYNVVKDNDNTYLEFNL